MEDILLTSLLIKHPNFTYILMGIGILRLIFKPLMMLIVRYVDSTPTILDNEKVKAFMNSKVYMLICFVFDLTASVKLPTISKDK